MRRDRPPSPEQGFTLMEIILVITIGLGLILSATAIFNVARKNAGTARARDKVLALQSLVEQVASAQGGSYPDMVQLPQLWEQHRPMDYDVSPWGGLITHGCPDGTQTPALPNPLPAFVAGIAGQASPTANGSNALLNPTPGGFVECNFTDLAPAAYATPFPAPLPAASSSIGELDYRRITAPSGEAATASFFDDALNKAVTVQSYAVSIRGTDGNDMFYQGR